MLSFMPMAALAYLFKALGRGRRKRGARKENPALGRVRLCAAYPVVRVTHWSNRGPIPKAKGPHGPVCDCTGAPQHRSERVHRLMIHYVSVGSNDIKRARSFYDPLMSLIGFRVLKSSAASVHYGASDIVFSLETPENGRPATAGNGVHVAFQAPDRETVRRFHKTAIENGGADEGPPGIRNQYNANYTALLCGT